MTKMYYTCKPVACIRCESPLPPSKTTPRRYCSDKCKPSAYQAQSRPARRSCSECGVDFEPKQGKQRHCSKPCRMAEYDRGRYGNPVIGPPRPLRCNRCGNAKPGGGESGRGSRLCNGCVSHDQQMRSRPLVTVVRVHRHLCTVCGGEFTSRSNSAKYCSDRCRRSSISKKLMGLYRSAIDALDVPRASMWHRHLCQYLSDRDGPDCALCGRRVNLGLSSGPRGHDQGPSVDHVVPTSEGGADDLANLQLTHWSCNRSKRAGFASGGEQLRLVG